MAARLAAAIERVAAALLVEEETSGCPEVLVPRPPSKPQRAPNHNPRDEKAEPASQDDELRNGACCFGVAQKAEAMAGSRPRR